MENSLRSDEMLALAATLDPPGQALLVEALRLYRARQPDAACRAVQRLMSHMPGSGSNRNRRAEVHDALGRTLHRLGDPLAAIDCYRQALTLRFDYAECRNNLGAALEASGALTEAVIAYRQSLALRPDNAAAWLNLHSCRYRPDSVDEAADCLDHAARTATDPAPAQFLLGCLRHRQGRIAAAAELFAGLSGSAIAEWGPSCWEFLCNLPGGCPPLFGNTAEGLCLALDAARTNGLVLECGVRYGTSIRQLAVRAGQPVYGFDTFQGLPDSWLGLPAGSYSTQGELPPVPVNVELFPGLFEHSLPDFLTHHPGPIRLLNIDCDLYRSTCTVLELCAARIVPGTILLFDEYLAHPGWREDEHRAFTEAAAREGWNHAYLAASLFSKQAIIQIVS